MSAPIKMHPHHHQAPTAQQQHHRRRKRRSANTASVATRSVDVLRGPHGFGFTISGQQPCILSCIVEHSPADLAGLRTGDFLVAVNGLNVSKLAHEAIVQLIATSPGTIRIAIAEHYYLDSSDEETALNQQQLQHQHKNIARPARPKFLQHKLKAQQHRNQQHTHHQHHHHSHHNHQRAHNESPGKMSAFAHPQQVAPASSIAGECVDAGGGLPSPAAGSDQPPEPPPQRRQLLEYSSVVGYLGTIEMPKQIATSSKLQTVRSCIRKLRQEKRTPTIVLMTILPNCLTLTDRSRTLLAKYPAARLSYVSNNSSEQDTRFFGLVTTAIHADGQLCEAAAAETVAHRSDVTISNSCHVFVVDAKMADHQLHAERAQLFQVQCTQDPISNSCLEFPSSSEYIVHLIRTMYNLSCAVSTAAAAAEQAAMPRRTSAAVAGPQQVVAMNADGAAAAAAGAAAANDQQAISPQPSNHTTSSNSDSGIGFHNDCTNISDRILVVDFPAQQQQRPVAVGHPMPGPSRDRNIGPFVPPAHAPRPLAFSHDMILADMEFMRIAQQRSPAPVVHHAKSRSVPIDQPPIGGLSADLLALRHQFEEYGEPHAAPAYRHERTEDAAALYSAEQRRMAAQLAAHSCDDMLMHGDRASSDRARAVKLNRSIEDMSTAADERGARPVEERRRRSHVFLFPRPMKKARPAAAEGKPKAAKTSKSDSFAAKVLAQQHAAQSVDDLRQLQQQQQQKKQCTTPHGGDSISGSLQNLCEASAHAAPPGKLSNAAQLGCAYSEPDLASRALQNNAAVSPFRRWGQSSFRTRQSEQPNRDYTQRRASSSESDFYLKTMNDELNGHQSGADGVDSPAAATVAVVNGPLSWGSSFEKLLDDVSGLHTFAEFLKKEFSAENIYFWTACERYRQLDAADRPAEAEAIFGKHLAVGAAEPVNVDSQARNTAQDNLSAASSDLFAQTQKQIFNLMKFDSYQRFIRSDLYKRCLEAEENGLPLPYPGDQPDVGLRTGHPNAAAVAAGPANKLKKSASNAEDRRRKSLLPWHRKQRCKSKDRQEGAAASGSGGGVSEAAAHVRSMLFASTSSIPRQLAAATGATMNTNSDLTSSRSSLSSFDAALSQRFQAGLDGDSTSADGKSGLCRVLLTDGATTIVPTRPNETIRELVERLLEKRGIHYRAFEAFQAGSNKPLNVDAASATIAGKEVTVDQRIVFKLDLPNRKVISVKSKTTKALEDVLRPILNKYNYRLDLVQVLARDRSGPLNMAASVQETDGQRLQVVLKACEMLDEEEVAAAGSSQPSTPTIGGPPTPTKPFSGVRHASSAAITPYYSNHQPIAHHGHSPPAYLPPPVPYDLQQHPSAADPPPHLQQQQQQHHSGLHMHHHQPHQRPPSYAQSHLDEITNKVFNELLQEKVVAQTQHTPNVVNAHHASVAVCSAAAAAAAVERATAGIDTQSTRSADWDTESGSSLFDRLRRNNAKKMEFLSRAAEPPAGVQPTDECGGAADAGKRPLMAKWKAGVKLQVAHKSENHDLLEGLKRAQRSRLEDQRGTEINFELPDFLKNKENFNKTKLRKIKPDDPVPLARSKFDHDIHMSSSATATSTTTTSPASPTTTTCPASSCPQPAPRLSITKSSGVGGGTSSAPSSPSAAEHHQHQPIPSRRNSGAPLDNNNSLSSHTVGDTSTECPSITFGSAYTTPDDNNSSYTSAHTVASQSTVSNATIASTCSSVAEEQLSPQQPQQQLPHHHHHQHSLHHQQQQQHSDQSRGPPPLPPKPKVLPIKPSNWAGSGSHNTSTASSASSTSTATNNNNNNNNNSSSNGSLGSPAKEVAAANGQSNIYLDQPSSSFV